MDRQQETADETEGEARDRPLAVLLHGIGRGPGSMALIAARLRREGFEVHRIGYPSTRGPITAAAEHVLARLRPLCKGRGALHMVGHSLGGLVAARIRSLAPDLPPGRIVQIGSPNLGSGLAGTVGRIGLARRWFGPALDELNEPVPEAGREDPDTGAIAGTWGIEPITRIYGVAGPSDGKVSVRSATAGARHRALVSASHAILPFSPAVARLTAQFLKTGSFEASA